MDGPDIPLSDLEGNVTEAFVAVSLRPVPDGIAIEVFISCETVDVPYEYRTTMVIAEDQLADFLIDTMYIAQGLIHLVYRSYEPNYES